MFRLCFKYVKNLVTELFPAPPSTSRTPSHKGEKDHLNASTESNSKIYKRIESANIFAIKKYLDDW